MARVQLTICRHNTRKLLQWKNGHVTVVGLSGSWYPLLNITNIIYMTTAVSRIFNILCIMFKIIECTLCTTLYDHFIVKVVLYFVCTWITSMIFAITNQNNLNLDFYFTHIWNTIT